jgi:hypothetical protein
MQNVMWPFSLLSDVEYLFVELCENTLLRWLVLTEALGRACCLKKRRGGGIMWLLKCKHFSEPLHTFPFASYGVHWGQSENTDLVHLLFVFQIYIRGQSWIVHVREQGDGWTEIRSISKDKGHITSHHTHTHTHTHTHRVSCHIREVNRNWRTKAQLAYKPYFFVHVTDVPFVSFLVECRAICMYPFFKTWTLNPLFPGVCLERTFLIVFLFWSTFSKKSFLFERWGRFGSKARLLCLSAL